MNGDGLLVLFALAVIIPLIGMFFPTVTVIATIILSLKLARSCMELHKYIHDNHKNFWLELGKPIVKFKLILSIEDQLNYFTNIPSRYSLYLGRHSYIKNTNDTRLVEMTKQTRKLLIISTILFIIAFTLIIVVTLPFLFIPIIANSIN